MQITDEQLDQTNPTTDEVNKSELKKLKKLRMRLASALVSAIKELPAPLVFMLFRRLIDMVEQASVETLMDSGKEKLITGQPLGALGAPASNSEPTGALGSGGSNDSTPPALQRFQQIANVASGGDLGKLADFMQAILVDGINAAPKDEVKGARLVAVQNVAAGTVPLMDDGTIDYSIVTNPLEARITGMENVKDRNSLAGRLHTAEQAVEAAEKERDEYRDKVVNELGVKLSKPSPDAVATQVKILKQALTDERARLDDTDPNSVAGRGKQAATDRDLYLDDLKALKPHLTGAFRSNPALLAAITNDPALRDGVKVWLTS